MNKTQWNIRREGRIWNDKECQSRYFMAPEKIELINGQLFWNDEERFNHVGLTT